MTTTNLRTPRRWHDLPVPVAIAICVFSLIAIAALFGKIHTSQQVAAVPTPGLVILIATPQIEPLPTTVPIQVAAALPHFVVCYDQPVNGAVLGPIPAPDASAIVARYSAAWVMTPWNGGYCWLHAADVGLPDVADLVPTDAPQVIYVAAQPAPAVATPEPHYAVTNDQQSTGDFYSTPPHVDPAAQQALIGSDPNALACGGSPLCGGLTNAQAQAALDAQR